MCERSVGDWTKLKHIDPQLFWLLQHFFLILRGCSTGGPEDPALCWVWFSLLRTATTNSKLWSPTNWLPVAPGYIIVCRPPVSVSVASAPNSTRQKSRLFPDIFDRMHLLFAQVHFLFDHSAGSNVDILQLLSTRKDVLNKSLVCLQVKCQYQYLVGLFGLKIWTAKGSYALFWKKNPGSNILQNKNYTISYYPSHKPLKKSKQDMLGATGEAKMNSVAKFSKGLPYMETSVSANQHQTSDLWGHWLPSRWHPKRDSW